MTTTPPMAPWTSWEEEGTGIFYIHNSDGDAIAKIWEPAALPFMVAVPEFFAALQAIAAMVPNTATNHAQLSALCIATARAAIARVEGDA